MIHCAAETDAFRFDCRTGRATLTTVMSMNAMLEPRIVAASTQRPLEEVGTKPDYGTGDPGPVIPRTPSEARGTRDPFPSRAVASKGSLASLGMTGESVRAVRARVVGPGVHAPVDPARKR